VTVHFSDWLVALQRSIPAMEEATRRRLEDFAYSACDAMYGRDERTGFQSIKTVWAEMGWDAEQIRRDTITNSQTVKMFNRLLFTEVLIPRLQRLQLISSRVGPRYRAIGLLD
jgi:hypothetical protein